MAGMNLRERMKGVFWITVVVTLVLKIWPPALAIMITCKCVDEYYRAVVKSGSAAGRVFHSVSAVFIGLAGLLGHTWMTCALLFVLLVSFATLAISSQQAWFHSMQCLVVHAMWQTSSGPEQPSVAALHSLLASCAGQVYVVFLFSHGILLLKLVSSHPVAIIVYTIFVTAGGENGALFLGALWQGTKPVPNLSPNKTLAGFISGPPTSVLTSFAFAYFVPMPLTQGDLLALGILIGLLGMFGDLFESYIKRAFGLKDIGTLLPGVGGLLDRMDGLVFTFPTVFYYLLWQYGPQGVPPPPLPPIASS